jgi:hypothetical protein
LILDRAALIGGASVSTMPARESSWQTGANRLRLDNVP